MSALELFGWVLCAVSCLTMGLCGFCFWAFVICPEQRADEDWTLQDLQEELASQQAQSLTKEGEV